MIKSKQRQQSTFLPDVGVVRFEVVGDHVEKEHAADGKHAKLQNVFRRKTQSRRNRPKL
jgi:hypothetical protein